MFCSTPSFCLITCWRSQGIWRHLGRTSFLMCSSLLGREIPPGLFFLTQVGLLVGRHAIPLGELLADFRLLVRSQILECAAILQHAFTLLRRKVAHLVHPGTRSANAELPARR